MKTLRRKILTPTLLLIILIPLLTLIIFNVFLRIYVQKNARADLQTEAQAMHAAAVQLLDSDPSAFQGQALDETMRKLSGSLHGGELSTNGADVLVFDSGKQLLFPKNTDPLSAASLWRVERRLSVKTVKNRVTEIRLGGNSYLLYMDTLAVPGNTVYLVLLAHLDLANRLLSMANLLLICIMVGGILIGVLVARRIAARFSKTVGQVCQTAEQIGSGKFATPTDLPTDILEFRVLMQSIARMAERLGAYDRAQKTFLQNASHELRTPLMSIQGYAEGIAQGVVPDTKAAAEIIAGESTRITGLVEELLTLSRLDSGTYDVRPVPIDLCKALPASAKRLGGLVLQSGREIRLRLPPDPAVVMGDEHLLAQSVENILSNGLRYARTSVTVSLRMEAGYSTISIADDGPGISPDALPHLFERFYKGTNGCFGLGLAIAQAAVRLMGGDVEAENADGGGAVFRVRLPDAISSGQAPS